MIGRLASDVRPCFAYFLVLIVLAFLLAAPASVFIFRDWLAGFAYHIELQPMLFILAILVVIAISWVTLAMQLVRASKVNPAVILRSE